MGEGTYTVSPAVIEQRREAATLHGASSEVRIVTTARAQKRAVLRRLRLRARDLDAVSAVYVDVLARYLAKVQLLDRYYEASGIVRPDGTGEPTLPVYLAALNGARLAARQLAEHLERRGNPAEDLDDYIDAHYSTSANGDPDA